MAKSQPTYTKEFKQQAVSLFETSGKNKSQIAKDLGISDSVGYISHSEYEEMWECKKRTGRWQRCTHAL